MKFIFSSGLCVLCVSAFVRAQPAFPTNIIRAPLTIRTSTNPAAFTPPPPLYYGVVFTPDTNLYSLQSCTNLAGTNWVVETNFTMPPFGVLITNNAPQKFFRVVKNPGP
jgi:hypothetical protein